MGKKISITLFLCLALAGASFASGTEDGIAALAVAPEEAPAETAYISPSSVIAIEPDQAEAPIPDGLSDAADETDASSACANQARERTYIYSEETVALNARACTGAEREDAAPSFIALLTGDDGEIPEEDCAEDDAGASLPEVPIVVNQKVESFIKYFQTRGRKHFEKWLARQASYMPEVQRILRENGMPEDLFYIALIESGLNPKAKSRAKAVGMWQFIKGTAKKYGLRVDWWIDERMDPEKATVAAAKYFKNLYGQFGSWYLAAAGYNAGEGRILRAMKKHKTDDFWELTGYKKPLRRETKDYVPKYLAAMLIAKDPASYGFEVETYEESAAHEKVRVRQATDLKVIAEAAGTTVDEIKRLNPELLRWFTPPDYPDYEIKLPAGSADKFAANISMIPTAERIRFHEHKVRKGDTISGIAKRYGTTANPIMYLNNLKNVKSIRPGTTIIVPVRAAANGKKGKNVAASAPLRRELPG